MDVEKKRSKGGFLHLFDWPGKSRKKLFSNSSELSDDLKQGNGNVGSIAKSRLPSIEQDETRTNSSNNGRSDFSCASSVTSDEGHGSRAPSVVARLMGLDSLPVPNAPEPRFNPSLDPYFLRTSHYANPWNGYEHPDYLSIPNNMESISWNHVELRTAKMQNRPIERFQTEALPPKSAKPISITHNRLLSPIRSPGFVPSKNAAYIMEAASRIIESSPRVVMKPKVSSVGAPSVPLRIRDLKEKLEAAHKASKPQSSSVVGTAKHSKGQSSERRNIVSHGTSVTKVSGKGMSDGSKNKGKSASLPVQAKTIIQKREGSTSASNNRTSRSQNERKNMKNRIVKSQPDLQRTVHKGITTNNAKTVLRQNNQKQNCRDNLASKTSVSDQQRKTGNRIVVNKVVVDSKIDSGSKKMGSMATRAGKEISLSRKKLLSRKEKFANGDLGEGPNDDLSIRRGGKSIKCNVEMNGHANRGHDDGRKEMDVISFTFSSPIKGRTQDPQSSTRGTENDTNSSVSSFGASSTYPSGINVIGGDALSVLLELKLRELTGKIESSNCSFIRGESSESTLKGPLPTVNGVMEHEKQFPCGLDKEILEPLFVSDSTLFSDRRHDLTQSQFDSPEKVIQSEEAEEDSISSITSDARKEFCHQYSSTMLDLDPPCSQNCLCNKDNISGGKQHSSESWPAEEEAEFSESASSISMGTFGFTESKEPTNWELEYVRDILDNGELMLKEFSLDQTQDIVPTSLFDQIDVEGDPTAKIERKVLFDYVGESLELKCAQMFTGSCKAWPKQRILFERKGWLAEELYKEISGWRSMGELMVDELVERDMSCGIGRWLDYEKEAFEEGIEIEKVILSSLFDDLVSDLLSF